MPTTDWDLKARVHGAWANAWWWNEKHDILAGRWATLDTWARLVLALTASLSAVSLLSDNPIATGIFAVATAIFSAINAALDPAARAANHRRASRDFRHAERRLGTMLGAISSMTETAYDPSAERYVQLELTSDDRAYFGEQLLRLEDDLETVQDAAPPINRLTGEQTNTVPKTSWGMRRLQRRLQRQKEASRMYSEVYQDGARDSAMYESYEQQQS
ncbi:hypothetical protein GA707_03555 [Nostocoides sp. F2B08]|uniref:hypothetical protein n=1 Tax=Nostocoides sp. F2B08 TaxID=2653936 RepID=UPI0012635D1D|nr:hypothetical protein [Tetrasphaera sp. F2B08]KAB7746572.1 hypothetical protein GA707_03555 [Tetrasphaera sp. F2B08]